MNRIESFVTTKPQGFTKIYGYAPDADDPNIASNSKTYPASQLNTLLNQCSAASIYGKSPCSAITYYPGDSGPDPVMVVSGNVPVGKLSLTPKYGAETWIRLSTDYVEVYNAFGAFPQHKLTPLAPVFSKGKLVDTFPNEQVAIRNCFLNLNSSNPEGPREPCQGVTMYMDSNGQMQYKKVVLNDRNANPLASELQAQLPYDGSHPTYAYSYVKKGLVAPIQGAVYPPYPFPVPK